jgi:hypothetical protein
LFNSPVLPIVRRLGSHRSNLSALTGVQESIFFALLFREKDGVTFGGKDDIPKDIVEVQGSATATPGTFGRVSSTLGGKERRGDVGVGHGRKAC